jgi:PAS domain S-box-containing protein
MPKNPDIPNSPAGLRHRAERKSGKRGSSLAMPHTEADARRLLHELEVHQIELEMQNAELRVARDEAEAMLEKYTDLYDFAPVGYFTLAADGTIRLVNLTGSIIAGVERSKLTGRVFGMLVTPEQRPVFKNFLKQVFAGEGKQSEDFEIAGGDMLPRIVHIEALRSPNGQECSVLVVDITERQRAEDLLRISEIRYRRLFEAAHDGVLLLDPATCRITDANPFMTKLLGYPREELIGKELFEIGLLKDEAASREMFRNLKKSHEVRYEDLPLKSQGGRHQEVEVVASLYQEGGHSVIQCNIRDITARKLAEEIMCRSEALFSALIKQAPVGVYVVDARFCLQQANPMAMPAFENVHPLIGRDFSEIMRAIWPRRVADGIIGRFRHTLETGEAYQSPRFVERRRDTRVKEIYEWQTQRVILPAGEFGVVCFFDNITERTNAETAQRRLEVLTASNLKLKREIIRRRAVEENLRATRQEESRLLIQSQLQQAQMRDLTRGILHAQEEERKRVSRELHDVIAQTLVGINIHLAALTQGAATDPASLRERISLTHLLVENAVEIVHDFARELRPTMLDDLGLIPALQTYVTGFMKDTGIRVSLKAFAKIERSTGEVRTVLYRVAQEALTNVARHAKASQVEVCIESNDGIISMRIKDDGQGFATDGIPGPQKNSRLGLPGMRERIEMIGGTFRVDSTPGGCTTVIAEVPDGNAGPGKSPLKKPARAKPGNDLKALRRHSS